ncbi:MAG: gamma-glutamylcyclotransferase [Chromatiales bacterium]|jgi:hypothetical protein
MLYLAYGSNLHPVRLAERVPSARLVRTVVLDGYRLAFHKRGHDDSAKCDLVRTGDQADRAYGAVYRIDPVEKPLLDVCEGLGNGYRDPAMDLACEGGPIRCFTYLAQAGHIDRRLRPFHWYKHLVLAGARYHGLPARYVERIRAVPSREDPDASRRGLHDGLLGRLGLCVLSC